MSDIDREKQAREAARRAQEEEIRRKRIQAQIDDLEEEKSECEKIIASLNAAKSEVASAAQNLASSAFHYTHLPTTAFSGASANATVQGMSGAMAAVNKSATSIMEVSDAISVQISRIQTYIGVLGREISALRSSL